MRNLVVVMCLMLLSVAAVAQPGKEFPAGVKGKDYNAFNNAGKREGTWIRVYASNPKVMYYKGQFKDGVPYGEFEFYQTNGKLMSKVYHLQDSTLNEVTNFHEDGKTMLSSGRYEGKKIEGSWKRLKEGKWAFYSDGGLLICTEEYHNDELNGPSLTYFENGQISFERNYQNGFLNGHCVEYNPQGKVLIRWHYKNNLKHGDYLRNWPNGNKMEEGKYHEGKQDGLWNFYSENGVPEKSIVFQNGTVISTRLLKGVYTEKYPSGRVKSECEYKDFKKNGAYTEYYDIAPSIEGVSEGEVPVDPVDRGSIKCKATYLNDKLNGAKTYFRLDGSVEKTEMYENGIVKTGNK
jgi:antitoxin component YwqK of YwqJK toxin-antitoxin module